MIQGIGGSVDVMSGFGQLAVSDSGIKYSGGTYEARLTMIVNDPSGVRPLFNAIAICAGGGMTVTDVFE